MTGIAHVALKQGALTLGASTLGAIAQGAHALGSLALGALSVGMLTVGLATSAAAQDVQLPAGYAPGVSIGFGVANTGWTAVDPVHPLPTAAKQEMVMLASTNVAAVAQPVYGGDYLFTQTCTGYGSVALQVLGPDGSSFLTLLTRTGADPAPVGIAIGSNAILRLDLAGTSGCAANLSRVP